MARLHVAFTIFLAILVATGSAVDMGMSSQHMDKRITQMPQAQGRPNFVLIQTDDQARWDDVAMNKTKRVLVEQGVTFTNYMVNTPICCPSRAEIFSGRYFHNVGAPNGSCMHVDAEEAVFASTSLFATLLSNGYQTGVFGKVTNDQARYFCGQKRADGMSVIGSPCDFGDYYGERYFVKLANGTKYIEQLKKVDASTYQTSQIANRTISWIRDITHAQPGQPFFAYIGPHAPHLPSTPAPWHEASIFDELKAPRTPNWNESCPDKHEMIANNPPLNADATKFLDHQHRIRQYSLLSVDDVIGAVHDTLQELNLLNSTYIILTSDHGYHLGQWRVPSSKRLPYDTDIFVTTLARGPGISAGSVQSSMVGNVDVAPTILDLAHINIPNAMDGKSMARLFITEPNPFYDVSIAARDSESPWREMFLIQFVSIANASNNDAAMWFVKPGTFHGQYEKPPRGPCPTCAPWMLDNQSNTYRGLRLRNSTHNLLYAEFNPHWKFDNTSAIFYEYYDLNKDPYQLTNVYSSVGHDVISDLRFHLDKYSTCEGGHPGGTCP